MRSRITNASPGRRPTRSESRDDLKGFDVSDDERYYRASERGEYEDNDVRERAYSPRRNRQIEEDIYADRDRSGREYGREGSWDNPRHRNEEDYNDRDFVGSRDTGRSNYSGGGGDLYRDLGDDYEDDDLVGRQWQDRGYQGRGPLERERGFDERNFNEREFDEPSRDSDQVARSRLGASSDRGSAKRPAVAAGAKSRSRK